MIRLPAPVKPQACRFLKPFLWVHNGKVTKVQAAFGFLALHWESKRLLRREVRRSRTFGAPGSDQNMPEFLRRFATTVLQPALITPEPMKMS